MSNIGGLNELNELNKINNKDNENEDYYTDLFDNPLPTPEYNDMMDKIHKNMELFDTEFYPLLHDILCKNIYKNTNTNDLINNVITFHKFTRLSFEYLMYTINKNKLTFHPYGYKYNKDTDVWMSS